MVDQMGRRIYTYPMRKLNLAVLMVWATRFENKSTAISFLVERTGIGFYSLRRVFQGKREPTKSEQVVLIQATGLGLDDLFPFFEDKKETA